MNTTISKERIDELSKVGRELKRQMKKISSRAASALARNEEREKRWLKLIKEERESISREKEEALVPLREAMRPLREEVSHLTLEEVVSLQPKKLKLEIIPVPKEGEEIVLLRSRLIPDCAYMLYPGEPHGSRWELRFDFNGISSRGFTLPCLCCRPHLSGIPVPGTGEEYHKKSLELGAKLLPAFNQSLEGVCRKNRISTLFVRNATSDRDRHKDLGITFIEGDQAPVFVASKYGQKMAGRALAFVAYIEKW